MKVPSFGHPTPTSLPGHPVTLTKPAELIERVKFGALRVLGERILFGRDVGVRIAHHARDERVLGEALLPHEKRERPIPPSAGGYLEHTCLLAIGVEYRPDAEALQQGSPRDIIQ